MSSYLFEVVSIVLYLGSALVIGQRLFRLNQGKQLPRTLGLGLGFAGLLFHAILLYQNIVTDSGLNLGFFGAGSLISWTVLLLLLLSSLSKPVENLGIALLPLAALTIALEMSLPAEHLLGADAPWGLRVHVMISLLAYSLLTLASVQSVLLAVQDHHLRHRHPGGFIRALPPLQTMETLLFEMIALGFALLTLSLLTGAMFLEDMFNQRLAHKTVLSIIAWAVFAILLWGRHKSGWRGQKALIWTLVGFVVLMLAYFGSKFVIELVLN